MSTSFRPNHDPGLIWSTRTRRISLGGRTWIMGIVNTTPDSFSDGGQFLDTERAVTHGLQLLSEGADILDIGGESTRPGAAPVSADEEQARTEPVVRELRKRVPEVCISIDTSKAAVAKAALEAGAEIVNDVTAGQADTDMIPLVAATGAGFVMMHMQGTPQDMQANPHYEDVVLDVHAFLEQRMAAAMDAGVSTEQIVLDPGIGFGKTLEHNLDLMRNLKRLSVSDRPLLLGVSRKRWLGELTGREVDNRLAASLAGVAVCIQHGAKIMRVHDVIESCDVARVVDRMGIPERHTPQ